MEIEPEESPDDNAVKIERNPSASGKKDSDCQLINSVDSAAYSTWKM